MCGILRYACNKGTTETMAEDKFLARWARKSWPGVTNSLEALSQQDRDQQDGVAHARARACTCEHLPLKNDDDDLTNDAVGVLLSASLVHH